MPIIRDKVVGYVTLDIVGHALKNATCIQITSTDTVKSGTIAHVARI